MSQAPERILAFESSDGQTWEESSEALKRDFPSGVEYIRADLLRPSELAFDEWKKTLAARPSFNLGFLLKEAFDLGRAQSIQPAKDDGECPTCDGKGYWTPGVSPNEECKRCHGTGKRGAT